MADYPEEQAGQRGGTAEMEDDMMDMAALLEQEESAAFHSLRRGEVVEGTIISINRDGVNDQPRRCQASTEPDSSRISRARTRSGADEGT